MYAFFQWNSWGSFWSRPGPVQMCSEQKDFVTKANDCGQPGPNTAVSDALDLLELTMGHQHPQSISPAMKISATILLATIAGAAADPTHQVSAAYNNLIFFDNEQIVSPTFVQDFTDASTFAIAGGISLARENGQALTWENLYDNARDVFTNIGFLLESGPTVLSPEDGFCVPCLTVGEAVGSVYAKMGGPDSQELGELLQANNADVLDPEAAEVIDSWLSRGECLDDDTCFEGDEYIVSVTYVGESSSGDQFVENYRVFFSPVPAEELQVAQPTSMEGTDQEIIRITRVDMVRWAFSEEIRLREGRNFFQDCQLHVCQCRRRRTSLCFGP